MKLLDQRDVKRQGCAHFFGIAVQLMRRILLDYAKSRRRLKRGGDGIRHGWTKVSWWLRIALQEKFDARQAKVVEMRFFGGWFNSTMLAVGPPGIIPGVG